jgi:hypothetical protein
MPPVAAQPTASANPLPSNWPSGPVFGLVRASGLMTSAASSAPPATASGSQGTGWSGRSEARFSPAVSGQGELASAGSVATLASALATISVTLSGAPRTSDRPRSAAAASAGEVLAANRPISSSATCPDSPSLQSTNTSPATTGNGPSRSTSTRACGPIDRVMMFLGGASIGSPPSLARAASTSQAREWSRESCSMRPLRTR